MHNVLKKREKIILYVTIGIIFFSIAFNFLIAPVLDKYDTLNKEVNLNKTKLKKYLKLLGQKTEIQNEYNKFSSSLALPVDTKDTLVVAMTTLENLAKGASVRIVDIRPQASPKDDKIIIELRMEGSIEGYSKFIYDVETSLLLLKVKRFQLAAKSNMIGLEGVFTIIQPVVLK
ncbi:MAG: hypothetical protein M0R48_01965 [Candidatus Omnitrophica bacterium]|jgi:hypothetical protein|nr:hypothetical protein [Candidatus Omnitrophota bacterium]